LTADVTILIPVWNRADLLRKLLDSISAQRCTPKAVIVIDNGSTDDAPLVAQTWGARVISMGRNCGFAAAANRGIAQSTTAWVALINSDVELTSDWLGQLLLAARETNAWFATGKILSAADPAQIDGAWDLVAKSGCAWRAGFGRPDSPTFSKRRIIAMSSATAALYRRELFVRIGNFAVEYESYLEDVDFSLRCTVEDLKGVYEPTAVCTHHGSASSGRWSSRVAYLTARNQRLLVSRMYSSDMRRRWRWKITIGRLLWGLVALRHGQFGAWLKGSRDGSTNRPNAIPHSAKLTEAIECAEREIFGLQRQSGWDLYWRLYFLITGRESQ